MGGSPGGEVLMSQTNWYYCSILFYYLFFAQFAMLFSNQNNNGSPHKYPEVICNWFLNGQWAMKKVFDPI